MITADELLRDEGRARRAAEGPEVDDVLTLGRELLDALVRGTADPVARDAAFGWLDLVRRGGLPARVAEAKRLDEMWPVVLGLIEASEFTLARLFAQRVETYGPRALFLEPGRSEPQQMSWQSAQAQVDALARGFLALRARHGGGPVAFVSENRLEMALCDLACLTTGVTDVMIPANLADSEVADVIARTGAGTIVVSGAELSRRLDRLRAGLPSIHTVLDLDDPEPTLEGFIGLPKLAALGRALPQAEDGRDPLEAAREAVRLDDDATVMFTSGTTGRPKGIRFTLRNIVTKRFARHFALPAIGDRDVFLCYLPLCHTFGRYLEMLGTIYWGATYAALPDPSVESLLDGFARVRPTVFISIPRRWMQLHEEVSRRADLDVAGDEEIREATRSVVGDRLRWGLSAAGYLSPEVFLFFQRNGVELMSGFGMTEATGGITMTPPGGYVEDSLGTPLPGIELRLEEDGELSVRGPYVTPGYYENEEGGPDAEGWLRTGDLFERDSRGHYRLIDRKKEIYKNSKGQTVSPQRVENLFRDIAAVRRVFLVGDHHEYNTALIVPDAAFAERELRGASIEEQRDAFRSIVASVNRFLAPFERIVDFAILDRDFSEERNELTPKGSFRRSQVVQNFADVIAPMYRRTRLRLGEDGPGLIFPNWLFQALALTAGDVRLEGERLHILPTGAQLPVGETERIPGGWRLRVGSCRYTVRGNVVDIGLLVTCPALWLGNDALVEFAPVEPSVRLRRQRCPAELDLLGRVVPYAPKAGDVARLEAALAADPPDGRLGVDLLDLAARATGSADDDTAMIGLLVLDRALAAHGERTRGATGHGARGSTPTAPGERVRGSRSPWADRRVEPHVSGPDEIPPELARQALRMARSAPLTRVRREALCRLWPREIDEVAQRTLERFLEPGRDLLDDDTALRIARADFSEAKLEALVRVTRAATLDPAAPGADQLGGLIVLLAHHGGQHPSRYQRLRFALAFVRARAVDPAPREAARSARKAMARSFRAWLGTGSQIAVDPELRREYGWDDVIEISADADPRDAERLVSAIRETPMLREAIFLLSGGATVRLHDIVLRGVRIVPAGAWYGRIIYRVSVETRYYGSFDIAVVVNRTLPPEQLEDEIVWLIVAGDPVLGERTVPEFGGYWPDYGLWTEEYIGGPTAAELVERVASGERNAAAARLEALWPHLVWSAAEAYIRFWHVTGRRLVVAEPGPSLVVVSTHDYQIGPKLISVAPRRSYEGPDDLLAELEQRLVVPLVQRVSGLAELGGARRLLASALIEVVGLDEGLALLEEAAASAADATRADELRAFVADVRARGFVARHLYYAIERYRRWAALAPDATREARAFTIRQLKDTYQLPRVYEAYPESRARFFRETVLRDAAGPLGEGLDRIVDGLLRREFTPDEIAVRLDPLREFTAPGSDEEYFLVRLSWPHIRPGDMAGFITHERGGVRESEVVVSIEDNRGRTVQIRRPLSPREVGDLHRLFLGAKLAVSFRPDHQFLVALDRVGRLVGGLFYEIDVAGRSAHLEKIVVAESYRQLGVSHGLMLEFLHRMQAAGTRLVTTGFFRPDYFARFGFRVDRGYGGQVRTLEA